LRRVVRDQIVCEFVGHDDGPIRNRIRSLPLLHVWQMQVLEIAVVEEKGRILIKRNRAPRPIIENMHTAPPQRKRIRAIEQQRREQF